MKYMLIMRATDEAGSTPWTDSRSTSRRSRSRRRTSAITCRPKSAATSPESNDRASLLLLGERVGWGRVMPGTDLPFDMAEDDPRHEREEADLDPADLRRVLEGTPKGSSGR